MFQHLGKKKLAVLCRCPRGSTDISMGSGSVTSEEHPGVSLLLSCTDVPWAAAGPARAGRPPALFS